MLILGLAVKWQLFGVNVSLLKRESHPLGTLAGEAAEKKAS